MRRQQREWPIPPSNVAKQNSRQEVGVAPKPARKTAVTEDPQNIEEQIRARAYQLYEERGRLDGYDAEDWLRAESEVRGGSMKMKKAFA